MTSSRESLPKINIIEEDCKSKEFEFKCKNVIERDIIKISVNQEQPPINGWTLENEEWFKPLLSRLKYYRLINNFYFFELKKSENKYSWSIIVISTLSSTLSVINTTGYVFPHSEIIIGWMLVISTLITTLISAYIKKQQFIDKINAIDRYLQQLTQTVEEININFILEPGRRETYDDFCNKYVPIIKNLSVFPSSISPNVWKRIVYTITTKYPELTEGDGTDLELLWPWYHYIPIENIEIIKENMENKKTKFGDSIISSYENMRV